MDVVIKQKADFLKLDSANKVRIEAFADERGTHVYNTKLTTRRAEAVKSALVSMGVSADQVEMASYGEANPVKDGHCEECWEANRRVDISEFAR